ncbi:MAG: DUF2934 domain-containing protein [Spirochaetota bacterium]|jgi:hypothetical protein|nr:DUF2934 domain-containing protein [Spirochaetota bacterium]
MAKRKTTEAASTEEVKKEATTETVKKTTTRKTTTKKAAAATAATISKEDFISEVEKRSYALFEERQRSGREGNSLTDWLEAEAEIKAKYGL